MLDLPRSSHAITTVVFDFDGVLADTERLHLAAFQEVFATRGWALSEAVYFDRYLGYDDHGLVDAYAGDQNLTLAEPDFLALVDEKTRIFAGRIEAGEVLYPGARRCVEQLAAHFSLGIASGALRAEIITILGGAGLLASFPVIVGADDVSACKPAPEPYLRAAELLGVIPAQCVAIEDSAPGLLAARTAGMRTIGLTTTTPRHLLVDADRILDGLGEVSPAMIRAFGQAGAL